MTNNMSYQQWGIHQCTAEWMDARMDKWTVVDSGVNHCTTNTFFFYFPTFMFGYFIANG